jgi:uncharacterized membrane protein YbhN (UPF0104 family)
MELSDAPSAPARSRRWVWLGAGVAATVFLLVFYRPFDWREVGAHVARSHPGWIAAAVIANLLILVSWTALWRQFLPQSVRVGWGRMGEIVALSAAGMNTLPFMGGHALGVGLLARRGGTGLEVAAAVMTLDQLCEGLCKVLLLVMAMSVAPLPDWMRRAVGGIAVVMGLLLVFLIWLSRRPAAPGRLARWAGHFEILRHPRRWVVGFLLSAGTKLAEAAGLWAAQHACGLDLPLAALPVVLAAVSVATMVSVSPGNLGVYEAAAVAAYALFGVPVEQAVALAFVQHACLLVAMIVPGYALTAWRGLGRPAVA